MGIDIRNCMNTYCSVVMFCLLSVKKLLSQHQAKLELEFLYAEIL